MHRQPSEREKRQLNLMRERLLRYRSGKLGLPVLIADLSALIDSLEEQEPDWKQSLRDRWSVLEEVYAVALDKGATGLSEEDARLVSDAVEQLLQMLSARGSAEGELGQ